MIHYTNNVTLVTVMACSQKEMYLSGNGLNREICEKVNSTKTHTQTFTHIHTQVHTHMHTLTYAQPTHTRARTPFFAHYLNATKHIFQHHLNVFEKYSNSWIIQNEQLQTQEHSKTF